MSWPEMVGEQVFALRGENRGLMFSAVWQMMLLAGSLAAWPFDRRTILGLNPWIKPLKFELSVLVFLLTVAVLLSGLGRLGDWPRSRVVISWGIGTVMVIENSIIVLQAARGVRSHMNYTSAFNGTAFGVMGIAIAVNTVLVGVLLALYFTTKTGLPGAVTLGVQLGLAALLAGSVEGSLMVGRYGAHTVGAADGGPGLPFVDWSTGHGDLRVAHFFALHALQLLMAVGWGASRLWVPELAKRVIVGGFAGVYGVGVWWLFTEAVAGRALWPR